MYYCSKCKRKHRSSGSFYKKHLKYKETKIEKIPSDKVISYDFENLPEIAQRQIKQYARKMLLDKKCNYGKKKEMYIQQINKVILRETPDSFMIK